MEVINHKLRVVVEVKPWSEKRGNTKIFEGDFSSIAHGVIKFLDKKYAHKSSSGIGAVVSGGTVPVKTSRKDNIEMNNLREYPSPLLPTSMDGLSNEEIKLLRILGFVEEI